MGSEMATVMSVWWVLVATVAVATGSEVTDLGSEDAINGGSGTVTLQRELKVTGAAADVKHVEQLMENYVDSTGRLENNFDIELGLGDAAPTKALQQRREEKTDKRRKKAEDKAEDTARKAMDKI